MNISPINNTNQNFKGNYYLQGHWTEKMAQSVKPYLEELAKGNKDIFAQMKTKRAIFDKYHYLGEKLYKLTIVAKKENPSFLEKCLAKVGLIEYPSVKITNHYHREKSAIDLYENRFYQMDYYKQKLKINY